MDEVFVYLKFFYNLIVHEKESEIISWVMDILFNVLKWKKQRCLYLNKKTLRLCTENIFFETM